MSNGCIYHTIRASLFQKWSCSNVANSAYGTLSLIAVSVTGNGSTPARNANQLASSQHNAVGLTLTPVTSVIATQASLISNYGQALDERDITSIIKVSV